MTRQYDNLPQYPRSDLQKEWTEYVEKRTQGPSTFQIGIWGTRGAGKTTYLAMLYDMLQLVDNWDIVPHNDEAQKFVEEQIKIIRQERGFPGSTIPRGQEGVEIFRYAVQYSPPASDDTTSDQTELSVMELCVVDAPGEFYESPRREDYLVKGEEQPFTILDYLSRCHGIIFLLDPERDKNKERTDQTEEGKWNNHQILLLNLMHDLYKQSQGDGGPVNFKLEQYMAFCVTKVDKEGHWEEWRKHNDPEKLVQKAIGSGSVIVRRLKKAYCKERRLCFFATSSIGRYPSSDDPKTWKENVIYNQEVPGSSSQPSSTHVSDNSLGQSPARPSTSKNVLGFGAAKPSTSENSRAQGSAKSSAANNNEGTSSSWRIQTEASHSEPLPTNKVKPRIKNPEQIIPENVINVIEPLEWLIKNIRDNPPRLPNRSKYKE